MMTRHLGLPFGVKKSLRPIQAIRGHLQHIEHSANSLAFTNPTREAQPAVQ